MDKEVAELKKTASQLKKVYLEKTITAKNLDDAIAKTEDIERRKNAKAKDNLGWFYVMRNAAFRNEIVKIGVTKVYPEERAKQLRSTGVPLPYEVIYAIKTSHYKDCENSVLNELGDYRVSDAREFMFCTLDQIVTHLLRKGYLSNLVEEDTYVHPYYRDMYSQLALWSKTDSEAYARWRICEAIGMSDEYYHQWSSDNYSWEGFETALLNYIEKEKSKSKEEIKFQLALQPIHTELDLGSYESKRKSYELRLNNPIKKVA